MTGPLLFLLKLAWESRYRIPLIITVGFMALDIRMQFEINIHMRRIRRRPQIVPDMNHIIDENRSDSDGSSDSWMTIDEEDEIDNEELGISSRNPERSFL